MKQKQGNQGDCKLLHEFLEMIEISTLNNLWKVLYKVQWSLNWMKVKGIRVSVIPNQSLALLCIVNNVSNDVI